MRPGDEDYDRSLKYFRKYVKVWHTSLCSNALIDFFHFLVQPILVAAAVDFEQVNGKRHGDLARRIADEIKAPRRLEAALDPQPAVLPFHWLSKSPDEMRRHELDGGIVIVGRHTLKEFLSGLKMGWIGSLEKVDQDELLARELEDDESFDEPDEPSTDVLHADGDNSMGSASHLPSPKNSPVFSPLQTVRQSAPPRQNQPPPVIPAALNTPPTTIPMLPPLLLVPFTNYIGFTPDSNNDLGLLQPAT
jgi:import inner membrane translocase subunit TIM54